MLSLLHAHECRGMCSTYKTCMDCCHTLVQRCQMQAGMHEIAVHEDIDAGEVHTRLAEALAYQLELRHFALRGSFEAANVYASPTCPQALFRRRDLKALVEVHAAEVRLHEDSHPRSCSSDQVPLFTIRRFWPLPAPSADQGGCDAAAAHLVSSRSLSSSAAAALKLQVSAQNC